MAKTEPIKFDEALRGLVDKPFLETVKYHEQQWRANRKGADPRIVEFERLLIARMRGLGVPMFGHGMVRTLEQQLALFKKGVSKASGLSAPHVRGIAVDIVHSRLAWDIPKLGWSLIGHLGKEVAAANSIKIEWGGDWKFYDPAHWQLK